MPCNLIFLWLRACCHRLPWNTRPLTHPARVLANPLARRGKGSFPMIGKFFSNGWKIPPVFSNDWKNFSAVFQGLEKIFCEEIGQTITTISDNFERETTWTTRDNS
ncbi:MAG: hypothetical protein IK066_09100 [Kiritimatiellae bacterium]|nr:hypothetical protein [Kiritimatiellia bacterium]